MESSFDKAAATRAMIDQASKDAGSDYDDDEFEVEDDYVCLICLDVLYLPVTTPCGHTYCKQCLKDAFDVKLECISCRQPILASFSVSLPVNITLRKLIDKKYP